MKCAVCLVVVVCCGPRPGAGADAPIVEAKRLQLQGRYSEAQSVLRDALRTLDRSPENCLRRAAFLDSLGSVAQDEGNFVVAEHFYLQSIRLIEKTFGEDHLELASSLDNLGSLYMACNRWTESERLRHRALDIRIRILGPDDPSVAKVLSNLAAVAWTSGKYADAGELAGRALDIYKKNKTTDSLELAPVYNVLGLYAFSIKDTPAARAHFERALAIYKAGAGEESPAMIKPLINFGTLDMISGRKEAGEETLRKALGLAEKVLGPAHRAVADVLANWAIALRRINRASEAKPLEKRARAILRLHANDSVLRHTVNLADLDGSH